MPRRPAIAALPPAVLTPVMPPDAAPDAPYPNDLTYLQDELRWVRVRAERIRAAAMAASAAMGAPTHRPWQQQSDEPPEQLQRRAAALQQLEDEIRVQVDLRLQTNRAAGPSLALDRVTALYGLDGFERTILLLAASTGFSGSFAEVWDLVSNSAASSLDVEVVFNFCELPWAERVLRREVFAPTGRLCANQLVQVHVHQRLSAPDALLRAEVQVTAQTFAYLCGVPGLDSAFAEFSSLEEPKVELAQVVLPAPDRQRILSVVERHTEYLRARKEWGFDQIIRYGRGVLMLFHGAPGTGKTMTAHGLAHQLGKRVLNVDIPTFVGNNDADRFLPALFREAKLHDALLFFDECEMLFADRKHGNALMTLLLTELERFEGVAVLATNLPQLLDEALDRRVLVKVAFSMPDPAARRAIWAAHLPATAPLADDVDLDALAERFEMAGGYIKNAVLLAVAEAVHSDAPKRQITMAMLESAAQAQLQRPREARLDLVQPKVRLADVVLPDALRAEVHELVAAARNRRALLNQWGIGRHLTRGMGVSALLHGAPGTGKTLCAEAIAAELCRPLMVAQVPALVSKWVGETESNLDRLFADARAEGAVLLLDECDALLTKRDEQSHRHDVSMVNVLLGLLERFDGVVLLATNRPQVLDSALARRMGWILAFELPTAPARAAIWRGLLPDTVPGQGRLDFALLGEAYPLSGGLIRNAVFKAAFRAAHCGRALTMADLQDAAEAQAGAAGLASAPRRSLPPLAEG